VKYNTFSDKDSVYHGDLGISVLDELEKSRTFTDSEYEILKKAIHNHGLARIEDGLNAEESLYAKMIRDADKMDIFKIVDAYYREMLKGKRNIALELGLKNENKLSTKVYNTFLKEEVILKSDMHYINDFKLLQVAWIYDLNFGYTRDYLSESNYLNSIIDQITSDAHREDIRNKAMDFLTHRN
jgi:tyrosine-protein phosphatase YwqE